MKLFGLRQEKTHLPAEALSSYLDNQLPPARLGRVERHLEVCAACVEQLEGLRATVDLLRSAPVVVPSRSYAVPRAMVPDRAWWPAPFQGVRAAAVAAAVVLAMVVGGVLSGTFGSGDPQAPVQVGMAEPEPLITSGTQPSPAEDLPLAPASDPGDGAVAPTGPETGGGNAPLGEQAGAGQGGGLPWIVWPLALAVALVPITAYLRRRRSPLR